MDPVKQIEAAVTSALDILGRNDNEEDPIGLSRFGRVALIVLCLAGTVAGALLALEGIQAIVAGAHPAFYLGVTTLVTAFLLLSKQIWLNRMGGGTFLFVLFAALWAVSWIVYAAAIYWVLKRYIAVDAALTDTRLFEWTMTAQTIAETVSLGAAIVLTSPPILLTLFLFSNRLFGLRRLEKEEVHARSTNEQELTSLLKSAASGDVDEIKRIVERRLDERDANGYTALMLAVRNGHGKAVKVLVDRGASVASQTPQGTTALMMAARAGNADIARMLIGFNSRFVDQMNPEGLTALILAVEHDHPQVVKVLVDAGADPYRKSKYRDSAIKIARRRKQHEVISLLKGAGVQRGFFGFRRKPKKGKD